MSAISEMSTTNKHINSSKLGFQESDIHRLNLVAHILHFMFPNLMLKEKINEI